MVNKRTGQKLEPETEFIVKLHDINDNEPQFSKEVYTGSVPERSDIGKDSHWTFSLHQEFTLNSCTCEIMCDLIWDKPDVVVFVSNSHVNVNLTGTSVIQVTATDADDSMYGNSAKLVYSISQGHPYFSVDPNTGMWSLYVPPMLAFARICTWVSPRYSGFSL